MTEPVAGVSYAVDVDLSKLMQLENRIDQTGKTATSSFNMVDNALKKTDAQMMKVTKTAQAVRTGFGGVGRNAGMAGIQLQQFVGQIQGGQSALVAFAQQSADLGFVLGVPLLGAVVSIAAAIGGILVAAITAAKNAGKELPDELTKRLEEIKKRYSEIDEESRKAFSQVELARLGTEITGYTDKINKLQMANALLAERIKEAADPRTIKQYEQQIISNERAIRGLNREQSNLILLQEKVGQTLVTDGGQWDQLNDQIEESVDKAGQFINQLDLATVKIAEGEEAALRLAAANALGLTNAEQLPVAVENAIQAYMRAKDAAAEEAEFRKQLLADQKEVLDNLEAERRQNHKDELQRIADEKAAREQRQQLASEVRFVGVSDQQAQLTALADQYAQQQALLQQALDLELITREDYAARKVAVEQQTQDRINEINQTGTQSLKDQLDSVGFSLDAFQNQAIGSFAAVATGAMSGKDAIRSLAQSILTTAIGALIKMAATAAIGQTTAAATGIATAATLSTAYATPAALVSLASFGANAVPASAGIASTVALAQGLSLGTGRLYGGPVGGGSLYPFMEDGKPEALEMGGKTYLWTGGGSGNVVSNGEMSKGGASNITVQMNIMNSMPGAAVESGPARKIADDKYILDVFVTSMDERGRAHAAVTRTTTAGNRI